MPDSIEMDARAYPKVLFPVGWNEQLEEEVSWKGWLHAQVETPEGLHYAVFFYDPVRLKQDFDSYLELGEPCLAEPALILLPELTVPAMEKAVRFLWQKISSQNYDHWIVIEEATHEAAREDVRKQPVC